MRRLLILIVPFASACSDWQSNGDVRDDMALPNVENPAELGRYVMGSWIFNSLELSFVDDRAQLSTEATTVYPDELTEVAFMDGSGTLDIQVQGGMIFFDDGTLAHYRKVWSSSGEFDEETVLWGEWEAMSEKVLLDTDSFFARAFVTPLGPESMFLDWDCDDPQFDGEECVYSIDLSRADEREIHAIFHD